MSARDVDDCLPLPCGSGHFVERGDDALYLRDADGAVGAYAIEQCGRARLDVLGEIPGIVLDRRAQRIQRVRVLVNRRPPVYHRAECVPKARLDDLRRSLCRI